MTKADFEPGDLVEFNKKRYVLGRRSFWGATDCVWGIPATKAGKADLRFEGGYLPIEGTMLIKRVSRDDAKEAAG